ncbi:hypothetical protein GCM10007391_17610 [Alteromonas halophila]|uniref:EAL domain-containing protein n=1 Tax=Alteromonas halophila TaxID=516698 RepID=A0A918MYS8_9ALTE|nr:hypothetical protein GCM10007391_17610 [Alteromonas halophila]
MILVKVLRCLTLIGMLSCTTSVSAGQLLVSDDTEVASLREVSDAVVLSQQNTYREALDANTPYKELMALREIPEHQRLWLKSEIVNQGTSGRDLVITINRLKIEQLHFYLVDQQYRIIASSTYQAGSSDGHADWPSPYVRFPFTVGNTDSVTVLIGIKDKGSANYTVALWDAGALAVHDRMRLILLGALLGMLFIAFSYFLLSYLFQRTPTRFWISVCFGLTMVLVFVSQGGLSRWPDLIPVSEMLIASLITMTALTLAKVSHNLFPRIPLLFRLGNYLLPLGLLAFCLWRNAFDATHFIYLLCPVIGVYQVALVIFFRDRRHPSLSQLYATAWAMLFVLYAIQLKNTLNSTVISAGMLLIVIMVIMLAMLFFAFSLEQKERSHSHQQLLSRDQTISSLHHFYDLFRNSVEGFYTSTIEGTLKSVNPAMCSLFGYDDEASMLASVHNTREFYADSRDRDALVAEIVEQGQVLGREIRGVRSDGEEFWFCVSCQLKKDSNGSFLYGSLYDITERKNSSLSIEFLASHDSLTGVYNRREFERLLANAISSDAETVCLLYMDLDRFKVVNDTCGHRAGDELIREIARLIDTTLSGTGYLGRLGGDEFGVLITEQPEETAYLYGMKILNAIQSYRFMWDKRIFTLGVSIGLVSCRETSGNPEHCLSMADAACYFAKEQGRNQIHRFRHDDESMQRYKKELDWVSAINDALEHDRFVLYYQPYRALSRVTHAMHFEVLLRLQNEDGTTTGPNAFLPTAERYNLSAAIDKWVVEKTLLWLYQNPEQQAAIGRLSINLSGQSLADREFKLHVLNAFEKYAIPYSKVCFEITESVAIIRMENTLNFMRSFTQLGCSFALDDFGSGFSSYTYLKNLPVDIVKIDGGFIRDMLSNRVDAAVVASITEVARAMGMETVGEFVESEAVMAELGKIGVDFAQGYSVAAPSPLASMPEKNIG